jgi:hypothetical protein
VAAEKKRGDRSLAYADALARLAATIMNRKNWSDAEPVLLECVTVLNAFVQGATEGAAPGDASQPLETEASPDARGPSPIDQGRQRLRAVLQQLVQLSVATGNEGEAARWRRALQEASMPGQ